MLCVRWTGALRYEQSIQYFYKGERNNMVRVAFTLMHFCGWQVALEIISDNVRLIAYYLPVERPMRETVS